MYGFIIGIAILTLSCKSEPDDLKMENRKLKKEIDSLKNQLYKCNLLIESYEAMPLNI